MHAVWNLTCCTFWANLGCVYGALTDSVINNQIPFALDTDVCLLALTAVTDIAVDTDIVIKSGFLWTDTQTLCRSDRTIA